MPKLHLYSSQVGLNPEYASEVKVDCGTVLSHPQVAFCWDDVATGKKLEGMPPQTCSKCLAAQAAGRYLWGVVEGNRE